jgi:hypothetical protein
MRLPLSLLLIISPFLVHVLVTTGRIDWAIYWLGGVIGSWGLATALGPGGKSRAGLMLAAVGLGLLLLPGWQGQQLFKLFPLAIYLSLAVLFASTLLPGRVPLVTRFASAMRQGQMPDAVIRYTRSITGLWVLFFCSMAAITLWLALYASFQHWSLFVNFISYALMAGFFLLEFGYRRWRLGELVDYSFSEFMRGLFRLDYAQLFRSR